MAKHSKTHSVQLPVSSAVEITRVPFTPFGALRQLDLGKLERASKAVVELGHFESSCCRRTLRAKIAKGKVVDLELEPCTDGKPASIAKAAAKPAAAELSKLIAKAKLAPGGKPPKLPAPVGSFFRLSSGGLGDVIDIDVVDWWTCYVICVTLFGHKFCFTCCTGPKKGGGQYWIC